MRLENHAAFRDLVTKILARMVIFFKAEKDIRPSIQGKERVLVPWEMLAVTVAERVGHLGRKARSYWLNTFFKDGRYFMGGDDPAGSKSIRFLDHLTAAETKARLLMRVNEDMRAVELATLMAEDAAFHRDVKAELRRLKSRKFINVPDKFRDLLGDDNLGEKAFPGLDLYSIMPRLVVKTEVDGYDKLAMMPRVLRALRKAKVVEAEGISGMAIPHPCGTGELEFYGGQDGLPNDIGLGQMDLSSAQGMLLTVDPRVIQIVSLAIWEQIQATGLVPLEMVPAGDREAREDRTYYDITEVLEASRAQGHEGFLLVQAEQREQLILRDGACELNLATSFHRAEAEARLQAAEARRREDRQERKDSWRDHVKVLKKGPKVETPAVVPVVEEAPVAEATAPVETVEAVEGN